MNNTLKNDWLLYQKLLPIWHTNYVAKLLVSYEEILQQDKGITVKFWELYQKINMDKNHPGVNLRLNKSTMLYEIAVLIRENVITYSDIEGFSDELKMKIRSNV